MLLLERLAHDPEEWIPVSEKIMRHQ